MITVEQVLFEQYVTEAIEGLPDDRLSQVKNVVFMVEQEPSQQQREKLGLRPCQSLFGLYEGVPLTERRGGYALTLPDRITIFKASHEYFSSTEQELKDQIKNTVWHEVAHYFGLGHDRIEELESKRHK